MALTDKKGDLASAQIFSIKDYIKTAAAKPSQDQSAVVLSYVEAVKKLRDKDQASLAPAKISPASLREKVKQSLEVGYAIPGMVDFITSYLLSVVEEEPTQARRLGIYHLANS